MPTSISLRLGLSVTGGVLWLVDRAGLGGSARRCSSLPGFGPVESYVGGGEVAEVREGAQPRLGAATRNGQGETVYLMAQMLRGENALEVLRGIHVRMKELSSTLPPDVKVQVIYDRSVLVSATLRTVGKNLLEGGLLVAAVLLLTLGSWRAGLLVALVIPLSMLGAAVAIPALASQALDRHPRRGGQPETLHRAGELDGRGREGDHALGGERSHARGNVGLAHAPGGGGEARPEPLGALEARQRGRPGCPLSGCRRPSTRCGRPRRRPRSSV